MNTPKLLFLTIAGILLSHLCQAQPLRTVTFSVDMNQLDTAFTEVYVNGSWNGWCGNCQPLADDGSNVWHTTIQVPEGNHEYLFTLDSFPNTEVFQLGTVCGVQNGPLANRELILTSDTTLPTPCFNSCFACGAGPDSGMVTFSVDMSNYSGSFNEVAILGSWNGWCGDCEPLSDPDNDSIWTGTYPVPGGAHVYLFTLDSSAVTESLPLGSSCGVNIFASVNRTLYVDGDTSLFTPCWNSCTNCSASSDSTNVTFLVDMSNEIVSANGVHLAGTFQGWNPGTTPLLNLGQGIWGLTVKLPPGEIQYKYINGQVWGSSEYVGNICGVDNGIGGYNRVFQIGQNDTTIAMHCFDSCDPCYFDYTFQVDLSEYPGWPFVNFVSILGDWNNWCTNCDFMFDFSGDSIYTHTLTLERGNYQFLYAVNGNVWEMFSGTESCVGPMDPGGPQVRQLAIVQNDSMDAVCWNSCTPCSYELELKVDLSNYQGSFDSVYVVGTMNNWCDSCDVLSLIDSSGIYATTLQVRKGEHSYHFSLDGGDSTEVFAGGESCTQPSAWGIQRYVNVFADTYKELVCWNECEGCSYDITFQIDMRTYQRWVSFDSVFLTGSMNDMCGTCTAMTDPDGDSIYSTTLQLPRDTYYYRYTVDNWADVENLSQEDACTSLYDSSNVYYRVLDANQSSAIDTVCWSSCEGCKFTTGIGEQLAELEVSVYPNPTKNLLFVEAEFKGNTETTIQLFSTTGQVVHQQEVTGPSLSAEISVSPLPSGIYALRLQNQHGSLSRKVVVQK